MARSFPLIIAGLLSALAINWLWGIMRLPGYNYRVFKIYGGQGQGGVTGTAEDWMGADNLALILVGVAMVIAGRKSGLGAFGMGWILGIVILKLGLELFNTNPAGLTNPASYALA